MKTIEEYRDLLMDNIEQEKKIQWQGNTFFNDLGKQIRIVLNKYGYRLVHKEYYYASSQYFIFITDLTDDCDDKIIEFYVSDWVSPGPEDVYSSHIFYKDRIEYINFNQGLINLYDSDFFQSVKLKYDLERVLPEKEVKKLNKI